MAYITSEQVKEMRDLIKKEFPASEGWKWSVTREHHSSVKAALMQYPDDYDFKDGYCQVNHYWFDTPNVNGETYYGEKETKVLQKVKEILHIGHWDESDIMSDYFNCSHYVNIHIGKWNKDAVKVPKKQRTRKAKTPLKTDMVGYDAEFLRVAEFIDIQF